MDSAEPLPRPWGKLARDVESTCVRVHPLHDHMVDVAACVVALCGCNSIRRSLEVAAGRRLDEVDVQRLGALAYLHDLGKANAGFQSRRWQQPERPPAGWPTFPFGHSAEAWSLFESSDEFAQRLLAGLPLESLARWGDEAVWELLKASISHHGRPVRHTALSNVLAVWRPVYSDAGQVLYDPAIAVSEMGRQIQDLFPVAFDTAPHPELPDRPAFAHLYAGVVQLADWLGSDTRDSFFPYSLPGETRASTAFERARHAVAAIGLDTARPRSSLIAREPTFAEAFSVASARPMQTGAADLDAGPLVVLEAETGSGKTEAALWRFFQLYQVGRVDALYFALPTRVAASQLYERACVFASRLWPQDAPVVVRALPGYEAADRERKVSLPEFKVQWPDNPSDAVAHRRWAAESPKRFLAATIAVGTIDQALLGALQVRHAHLRHAMLARSLLVVDEVHASDAYMGVLLERLLHAHLRAGGEAMLLSATLGSGARCRLLACAGDNALASHPGLSEASAEPYPLVSVATGREIRHRPVQGQSRSKPVAWRTLDSLDQPVSVAEIAVSAARMGARVLVVRNTVPAAVATLQAVEAGCTGERDRELLFTVGGVSTLHHSRFSRIDRPLLDAQVERLLGKWREAEGGRIVVGTQTLEQSLDIDADLLITDLCPMDVLLQRLGRLHRHDRPPEERPSAFREPQAWVLTPPGHDLSSMLKRARYGLGPVRGVDGMPGGVYPDLRILEATRRLVDERRLAHIPEDNRQFVERATHPEALAAIERELQGDWIRHGEEMDGIRLARRTLGQIQALDFDQRFSDLQFPDAEQKVATRLGAADRLLELPEPRAGPFGLPVQQLALRFHQVPAGLSPDEEPRATRALPEGGFEFELGSARFRYNRFGLARQPARTAPGQPEQGA